MFGNKKKNSNDSTDLNKSVDNQQMQNRNNSKQKKNGEDQQSRAAFMSVLAIAGSITLISAVYNIWSISRYDASENITPDTSAVDTIKNFITTETTTKYLEVVNAHTNLDQIKDQDIKVLNSNIGRAQPFAPILNKSADNTSTKLFKFMADLKSSIKTYKFTNNGELPFLSESKEDNQIDLNLLESLLNLKDESLKDFTYTYVPGSGDDFSITIKQGDVPVNIVLFDYKQFVLKNVTDTEASLVQGKYSLILKPMEEYNNITLEKVNPSTNSVTIYDAISGKTVQISK